MQKGQKLSCVLFAVIITVWLIQQLKGFNEDIQAFLQNIRLHCGVQKEFLEDLYWGITEISITERNKKVIFQAWEYLKPLVNLFFFEILL